MPLIGGRQVSNQYEDVLHASIEMCLRETFGCTQVKHECTVAIEEIAWKGYTIDVVGYDENTKPLYVVEAKNVTSLGSSGVAQAIEQIVLDMAGLREREVIDSIRKYGNVGDKEVSSAYFYIALPNFQDDKLEKMIHPPARKLLATARQMLSDQIGVLEVYDLEKPARVFADMQAKPFPM